MITLNWIKSLSESLTIESKVLWWNDEGQFHSYFFHKTVAISGIITAIVEMFGVMRGINPFLNANLVLNLYTFITQQQKCHECFYKCVSLPRLESFKCD